MLCTKNLISPIQSMLILLSSHDAKNISLCPSGKSSVQACPVPRPIRGALRGRHDPSARDAMDAAMSKDERQSRGR
jgi:hypothetical protein